MLHITNGSSVSLAESGLGGDVLVWLDVLHEGPVPAGLPLEQLSRVRAEFLDAVFPQPPGAVAAFEHRDRVLHRFVEHEEVVLWFEHDLFDQLQLIQLLDWFHERDTGGARLSMICSDRYLGPMRPPELAALWPSRHTVTPAEMGLAAEAWAAFRSPDPRAIECITGSDSSALPHLAAALIRHLEQFPSVANGLARTEQQILQAVDAGVHEFNSIFSACQAMEDPQFMGDCTFHAWLDGLARAPQPLLRRTDQGWKVTPHGRAVLTGASDHIHLNGIDRWLGGVQLVGQESAWRWNGSRLVAGSDLP